MRPLGMAILIVALTVGCQSAWGDCIGGKPYCTLEFYWDSDYAGDMLAYQVYYDENHYVLAVSVAGSWWGSRISSIYCWDDNPAHWWIYNNYDCDGYFTQGDGASSQLDPYNDQASALKFRCPEDKTMTYLAFCEDENYGGQAHNLYLYKNGASNEVVIECRKLDGHWNDEISSLQTSVNGNLPGAYCHWYFYHDKNFNEWGDADFIVTNDSELPALGSHHNDQFTSFRLRISNEEDVTVTGIRENGHRKSATCHLGRSFPNPFNPSTTIEYGLPEDGRVFIAVYDVAGRLIRVLQSGEKPRGNHSVTWDGRDSAGQIVAAGIYFCRMQAGSFTEVRKLALLR